MKLSPRASSSGSFFPDVPAPIRQAQGKLLNLEPIRQAHGQDGLPDLWSPREDVGSLTQEFKKSYIGEKFTNRTGGKNTPSGTVDAAAVCQAELSGCG
jgi:hypothetical protein